MLSIYSHIQEFLFLQPSLTRSYFALLSSVFLSFASYDYDYEHYYYIVNSFTLYHNDMLRNTERTIKWNDAKAMMEAGGRWMRIEKLLSFTMDVAFSFHVSCYLAKLFQLCTRLFFFLIRITLLCYSSLKTITMPLFVSVDCQTILLFIVFGDGCLCLAGVRAFVSSHFLDTAWYYVSVFFSLWGNSTPHILSLSLASDWIHVANCSSFS